MTDGYVGNDFEVLDLVQRLRGTSRWFPFGTGNSVNRFLIDGMARLGGGEPYYVLLGEPGDTVARTFYEHIASPVLTDVHVEWQDLDVVDTHPDAPADVWAERPLVIHARYRRAGSGTRRSAAASSRASRIAQELAVTLPEQEPDHAAIASHVGARQGRGAHDAGPRRRCRAGPSPARCGSRSCPSHSRTGW